MKYYLLLAARFLYEYIYKEIEEYRVFASSFFFVATKI